MSAKSSYYDTPGIRSSFLYVAAVAAATATESHPIFVAPCACVLTSVNIVPQAAVTGDNTNKKNLNIINAGSAGSGSTEVGNLDLSTGTNLVAFDQKNIPLNATYTAGVTLAEGDVVKMEYEKVGNGVLVPELIARVEFRPV